MQLSTSKYPSILNIYPEGCSFADDQGLLPLHLAMNYDNIDDVIVKSILNINPSAVDVTDNHGRLPIAMKGRAVLFVMDALLTSKLREKSASRVNEINILNKKLELQNNLIDQAESSEFQLSSEQVEQFVNELEKYRNVEEMNKKREEIIALQTSRLTSKEEELKEMKTKLITQESCTVKYRVMNENLTSELDTALAFINELDREVNDKERQITKLRNELTEISKRRQKKHIEIYDKAFKKTA